MRLQLTQGTEFSLRTLLLGAEFQQGSVTENARCGRWILFTGELKHQLIRPHGLQGGLGHAKAVDTAIEHSLHRLHFPFTNHRHVSGRLHLHRQLTAAAQVKSQLQRRPNQKHARRNGQGKNKGEPALIARHQIKPLDAPSAGQRPRSGGAE